MATPPATAPAATPLEHRVIVVVSHSNLFYWWPVWAVGYLLAIITFADHELMVTVPRGTFHGTNAEGQIKVAGKDMPLKRQDVLIAPEKKQVDEPHLQMTPNKSLGVIFAITLVLVIFITNVPLRGLWSVIVIITIILVSVIFALTKTWDRILEALSFLDIRINLAGYLFIATVLLLMWLIVFFFFDRQVYMVFTPSNVRLQTEIGGGETSYDTTGMTVQKQRNDLFRHWILGLGSGDLIVRTAGAQPTTIDLPNVLSLGRRVREIEELLRTKQVVATPPAP